MSQQDLSTEVIEALMAGRKVEAIKLYRGQAGVGLKEAKQAVDRWLGENPGLAPESNSVSGTGCLLWIIGLAIVAYLIWYYVSGGSQAG